MGKNNHDARRGAQWTKAMREDRDRHAERQAGRHLDDLRHRDELRRKMQEFMEQPGEAVAFDQGQGQRPDYRGQAQENAPRPKWQRRAMSQRSRGKHQTQRTASSGGGNYLDAHYVRMRLADDLRVPMYERLVDGMVASNEGRVSVSPIGQGAVPHGSGEQYVAWLSEALEQAETFAVSLNMYALVDATAQDMPDEPLRPEDLPSKQGFLYLPRPWGQYDVRGDLIQHHAVLWDTLDDARVAVQWFTDRDDMSDDINATLARSLPEGNALTQAGKYMPADVAAAIRFGKTLQHHPDTALIRMLNDYKVLPEFWQRMYDVAIERVGDDETGKHVAYVPHRRDDSTLSDEQFDLIRDAYAAMEGTVAQSADPLRKLVCFWRMCQQTLSAREFAHPDRATRKQLIRRKLAPSAVTVITLRRRKHATEGHTEIEWDHRWVRRGHWRQQWFGPHSGERYQRAIYINPTICGPEDKPLIIRPHVNLLAR